MQRHSDPHDDRATVTPGCVLGAAGTVVTTTDGATSSVTGLGDGVGVIVVVIMLVTVRVGVVVAGRVSE
jgi:hypothetical protein